MRGWKTRCKAQGISPRAGYFDRGAELESFQRPAREETPGSAPTAIIQREENMAIDPICKMDVDPKTAKWKSTYNGKEYFFCAPGCKKAFDKNPEKYA